LQIQLEKPLIETLPTPAVVRERLGDTLREVDLLRRLLRLAKAAEQFRHADRGRCEHEKGGRDAN
jgi:hypothetical protein